MKFALFLLALIVGISWAKNLEDHSSVYDFTVKDIEGSEVKLDKYKGHVLLIVNVASNCGLTEMNYKQLNELYDKYQEKGLRILAFPSNQFMNQEPGTDKEIAEFAKNHNVKFDMFSKIDVNGDKADPFYKFLKSKQAGTTNSDGAIEWNFAKFIVDKNGQVVERHIPKKEPKELVETIEKYL